MSCGCGTNQIVPVNPSGWVGTGVQTLAQPKTVTGNGQNMCSPWIGAIQPAESGQVMLRNGECMNVMYSQVSGPMRFDASTQTAVVTGDGFFWTEDCTSRGLPAFLIPDVCSEGNVRQLRALTPVKDYIGWNFGLQNECGSKEYKPVLIVPKKMPSCPPTGLRRTKSLMKQCGNDITVEHYQEGEIHQDDSLVVDLDVSETEDNEFDPATMFVASWQKIICTDTNGQQNIGYRLRKFTEALLKSYLTSLLTGISQYKEITNVNVGSMLVVNPPSGFPPFLDPMIPTTSPSGSLDISTIAGTPIPAGTKVIVCQARSIIDHGSGGGDVANAYVRVNSKYRTEAIGNTGGENSDSCYNSFDVELDANGTFTYDVSAIVAGNAAAYSDLKIVGYRP